MIQSFYAETLITAASAPTLTEKWAAPQPTEPPAQGSIFSQPVVSNGVVYWGSGYAHIKPGKPNNAVFAFAPTR